MNVVHNELRGAFRQGVTGDFGNRPKSVTINRNGRSHLSETAGHALPKWAVTMGRNTQPEDMKEVGELQKTYALPAVRARPVNGHEYGGKHCDQIGNQAEWQSDHREEPEN